MTTTTTEADQIRELQQRVAHLERLLEIRNRGLFDTDDAPRVFRHRFDFVWPSLKNTVELGKLGGTAHGRATLRKKPEVRRAQQRIRCEVEKAIGRTTAIPLFPDDTEVGRQMVWNPREQSIEVTWYELGPKRGAEGRKRDLVNLGALLDDSVGRERMGRRFVGNGLIYRDDAQLAETHETRLIHREGSES